MEQFLEDWITGRLPDTDEAFERLAGVMAPSFHIVGPAGEWFDAGGLLAYLRRQHGTDPDTRRWVVEPRVAHHDDVVAVVVFDEWQMRDGETLGSRVGCVFRSDPSAPNGVQWLHIHETRLPAAEAPPIPT